MNNNYPQDIKEKEDKNDINFIKYINKKKINFLIERDYDSLISLEEAINKSNNNENTQIEIENIHYLNLKNKIKKIKNDFLDNVTKKNNELNEKLLILENKYKNDLNLINKKFKNNNFIQKFSHPSNNLLQLRFIEHKYLLQKNYNEAELIKNYTDNLQKNEEKNIQKIIQNKYFKEIFNNKKFYLNNIEKIKKNHEKNIKDLEIIKNKELFYLKKQINLNNSKIIFYQNDENINFNNEKSLYSPRSYKLFKKYRFSDNYELNIQPKSIEEIELILSKCNLKK